MSRGHGWIGLVAGVGLLLPVGDGATGTGAAAAVPIALPSPTVSEPRLGFVGVTDRIVGVTLRVPNPPVINLAAAGPLAAAAPIWDPSAAATAFGVPGSTGRE